MIDDQSIFNDRRLNSLISAGQPVMIHTTIPMTCSQHASAASGTQLQAQSRPENCTLWTACRWWWPLGPELRVVRDLHVVTLRLQLDFYCQVFRFHLSHTLSLNGSSLCTVSIQQHDTDWNYRTEQGHRFTVSYTIFEDWRRQKSRLVEVCCQLACWQIDWAGRQSHTRLISLSGTN